MSALLVQDYLQTQGLQLPQDEVLVALRLAQAVISMGAASVERSILWYANDESVLAEHIEADAGSEALLKQIFMALDSAFERAPCQSAVVYGLMPSENENTTPYLLRLAQQGAALAQVLLLDEAHAWTDLPSRTAQTGWLNLVQDVPHWLSLDELQGGQNLRSQSQMSLPICRENGAVLGVLQLEHAGKNGFDEAAQIVWVALALALAAPLQALLRPEKEEEAQDE